jgi:WD40 repeat protein
LAFLSVSAAAVAAEVEAPPADKEPLLRVDAGGPVAFVTALAFSPDGKTLYAGGWDKVIRVWTLNDKGNFQLSPSTYRVPVGPGLNGAINALALSPDGEWLAAAGNGMARQIAGFHQLGFIVPAFGVRDPDMLRDTGTIYLFNTRDRSIRMLRGHEGSVMALTFGPRRGKAIPLLLSVAVEEKKDNAVETQLTARLWDPNKRESLAALSNLPSKALVDRRPGVILWQSGGRADEVQAALALHDGNLRVWDAAQKQDWWWEVPDLVHNLGVAYLNSRNRLLTAGYNDTRNISQLALWRIVADGKPERERRADIGKGFARALGLLSRQGDGAADLAAVLVLKSGSKGEPLQYILRLIDLAGGDFDLVKEAILWEEHDAHQPVVAASLRGEHLAVAGSSDHIIRVYSLRALLGEKKPQPQLLRGNAVAFQHASFVRRGKDLGLLLNRDLRKSRGGVAPEPDKQKGDWIFDFGKRRLTDDLTDWQTARPNRSSWRAKREADERTILILDGEKQITTITVPKPNLITDYALLPPGESVKVPLLALATHKNGQPRLAVYNAKSGEWLREFTGHTERLRCVAFAPDGQLLVSAADDGTVCVWSLTDLNTILGQHGRLAGVIVAPADKGVKAVKVLEVKSDSPVRGKLKRGNVLAGLVENKKFRRIESPRGFYEALYRLRPGTEISLRRGDPDGNDDISFVVGQGVDERKPLFSLFVIGGAKVTECEWIGWNPLGPYEASSPRAEKYLGWHFNTGDPKAPTRFADAGQYRKFYYRRNLLEQLIQRGALGMIDPPQLPPPVLGVWVADDERLPLRGEQETVVVRRPRIDLTVSLFGPPLSSLANLNWQLDDGAATPLDLERRGDASFRVPVTLTRGEHRFVVTARPHDGSTPVRKSVILRYQPLRPEVVIKGADQQLLVRQDNFTLEADIKPKVSGETVQVTILHRHDEGHEKPVEQTLGGRAMAEGAIFHIEHKLKLRPGINAIEVIAVHGGAPAGAQEQETGRTTRPVFYYFKAKPPVIAFQKVVPVSGAADEEALTADVSGPMIVRRSVVKIVGQIKALEEPLTEALWDLGKDTEKAPLVGFKSGKPKEFPFEQRLSLKPGKQIVRVRAKSKNSNEVEHNLLLEYQPEVPKVVSLTAPRDGHVFEDNKETMTVRVQGKVQFPAEAHAYKATIRVNGEPASQAPVLDQKAGTLDGTAVIGPGENRIWVEVSNEWGASASSEVILVHYVRPPIIAGKPAHVPIPRTSLINLTVPVVSWAPLESESVHVEVNGKESAPKEILLEKGQKNRWTVRLLRVPLDAGSREQKIVLHLANTEAPCRAPAVLSIRSETVLPAPEAEFLDPRQDRDFSNPYVTVRFQVRSEGKLESVRLLHEGREWHAPRSIPVGDIRPVGQHYELTATEKLELDQGPNRLSIDAVSVGGRPPESPRLLLSYTPPPILVQMERLTELTKDGKLVEPLRNDRGNLIFPETATGLVWLHGRVTWTDTDKRAGNDPFLLNVFVNGFQQIPFRVRRGDKTNYTEFQVQLLLNRRKNRISLLAPQVDAGNPGPMQGEVDCAEPITAQRLHVLALSPYSQPDEVNKRLQEAIREFKRQSGNRPPVFGEVIALPPLTRDRVNRHYLNGQIHNFDEIIQHKHFSAKHPGELMNEVLMIYYEGREKIDDNGHYFETYSPNGGNAYDMPCDKMVSYLFNVPGAHVLLLDVDRRAEVRPDDARDTIKHWEDNFPEARTHVVVMRCARRGGPVRLIPVLEKQIPQAARLSELIKLIEDAINNSNNRGNLLVFTQYLPRELADMIIGPLP